MIVASFCDGLTVIDKYDNGRIVEHNFDGSWVNLTTTEFNERIRLLLGE